MSPIVFHYKDSRSSHATAAAMLRFTYVITGFAAAMGDMVETMSYYHYMGKLNFRGELAYLEAIAAKQNNIELLETIRRAIVLLKAHNAIKHKKQQQIVTFKKFQQALHETFLSQITAFTDYVKNTGIAELNKLVDGASFGFFNINSQDPETTPGKDEFTASQLLTNDETAENKKEGEDDEISYKTIFFLSSHFFDEAFAGQYKLVSAHSKQAEDISHVYVEDVLQLPNIIGLTVEELKKVKTQLEVHSQEFKKESVSYFEQCYKNHAPADCISTFTQKVLPAAQQFNRHIQQNEMLQLSQRAHLNQTPATIAMGELPVVLLWQFYRYMNLVKDETWVKLQPLMEHEKFKNRRWPFLVIKKPSFLDEKIYTQQQPDEFFELTAKKYIAVD